MHDGSIISYEFSGISHHFLTFILKIFQVQFIQVCVANSTGKNNTKNDVQKQKVFCQMARERLPKTFSENLRIPTNKTRLSSTKGNSLY